MSNPLRISSGSTSLDFRYRVDDPASNPGDVVVLAERLDAFLAERGASTGERHALHLAVEELLTNLAKYGGSEGRAAPLEAEGAVTIADDAIRLTLRDNGGPFDPTTLAPPDTDDGLLDRPLGGLGLFTLFQTFHSFAYRLEDGCNVGTWTLRRGGGES